LKFSKGAIYFGRILDLIEEEKNIPHLFLPLLNLSTDSSSLTMATFNPRLYTSEKEECQELNLLLLAR
jgi:hypothetical protein